MIVQRARRERRNETYSCTLSLWAKQEQIHRPVGRMVKMVAQRGRSMRADEAYSCTLSLQVQREQS
jgi:hypothetical protein